VSQCCRGDRHSDWQSSDPGYYMTLMCQEKLMATEAGWVWLQWAAYLWLAYESWFRRGPTSSGKAQLVCAHVRAYVSACMGEYWTVLWWTETKGRLIFHIFVSSRWHLNFQECLMVRLFFSGASLIRPSPTVGYLLHKPRVFLKEEQQLGYLQPQCII